MSEFMVSLMTTISQPRACGITKLGFVSRRNTERYFFLILTIFGLLSAIPLDAKGYRVKKSARFSSSNSPNGKRDLFADTSITQSTPSGNLACTENSDCPLEHWCTSTSSCRSYALDGYPCDEIENKCEPTKSTCAEVSIPESSTLVAKVCLPKASLPLQETTATSTLDATTSVESTCWNDEDCLSSNEWCRPVDDSGTAFRCVPYQSAVGQVCGGKMAWEVLKCQETNNLICDYSGGGGSGWGTCIVSSNSRGNPNQPPPGNTVHHQNMAPNAIEVDSRMEYRIMEAFNLTCDTEGALDGKTFALHPQAVGACLMQPHAQDHHHPLPNGYWAVQITTGERDRILGQVDVACHAGGGIRLVTCNEEVIADEMSSDDGDEEGIPEIDEKTEDNPPDQGRKMRDDILVLTVVGGMVFLICGIPMLLVLCECCCGCCCGDDSHDQHDFLSMLIWSPSPASPTGPCLDKNVNAFRRKHLYGGDGLQERYAPPEEEIVFGVDTIKEEEEDSISMHSDTVLETIDL